MSDEDVWLWTFSAIDGPTVPLGLAHSPAPPGLLGVSSHNVGKSTLAQLGADASEGVSIVYDGLNIARKFDHLLSKLPVG